jgi:hypothetical protein
MSAGNLTAFGLADKRIFQDTAVQCRIRDLGAGFQPDSALIWDRSAHSPKPELPLPGSVAQVNANDGSH